MKKALILGALAGQVDAVATLQARGVETHVCAHLRSGPGVEAADHFHLADITDPAQIADLARSIGADVVYSVGSDIAMPTVAKVSEELGLRHFHGSELTDVLRRKQVMRARLAAASLSPVRYVAVEADQGPPDWDVFPCFVKPVDSQGQRGITMVREAAGLPAAIEDARASSVSGPVIIEEFLEGPEVSAHLLVDGGEIKFFVASDRHVWEGPAVGVPCAHSLPLGEDTRAWEPQFRSLTKGVVAALNVQEGPLYVQAIFTDVGPRIVEIASRLDGCHLWRLVKLSTGIDIMDAVLGRLLGDRWPEFPDPLDITPATLGFVLDSPDTVVSADYIARAVRDDAMFSQIQVAEGEQPRRTNDAVARIGYQIYGNH